MVYGCRLGKGTEGEAGEDEGMIGEVGGEDGELLPSLWSGVAG